MDVIFNIFVVLGAIVALILLFIFLIFFSEITGIRFNWSRKSYVVSYRPDKFTALNAEQWVYLLMIESKGIFGKRRREVIVNIPFNDSVRAYHEYWDQLIALKKPVKI